jgi:uncharacterized oxidoreductase
MQLSDNTILITGGASGIGLALAARFLTAGSTVIAVGRREDKLREAQQQNPGLVVRTVDLGHEQERRMLADWLVREHPHLNVLVNNAGIQRRFSLAAEEAWSPLHEEIAVNLEAPIHLSGLLLPHLLAQPRAAILNVTSGLAFSPMSRMPVYCATKAALRSFTLSLRHQLAATPVEVIEVIPPAVNTDLGGVGLHDFGVPVADLVDHVMARLAAGDREIAYGMAEKASRASRAELDETFRRMNEG